MDLPEVSIWWTRDSQKVERLFEEFVSERVHASDQPVVRKAKELAAMAHASQERQGGGPYLVHPLRVALLVATLMPEPEVTLIVAALLHDVIEDGTEESKATFRREFPEAYQLVESVSRQQDSERRGPAVDQLDSPYLEKVRHFGDRAILVKIADKIDNVRDAVWHPDPMKRRLYVLEAIHVYLPLAASVADRFLAVALVKELTRAIEGHASDPVLTADPEIRTTMLHELAHQHEGGSYFRSVQFEKLLFKELSSWAQRPVGQAFAPISVPQHLPEALAHYHLQNPQLTVWLSWDGVQVVPTRLTTRRLAANVARSLLGLLHRGQAELLLRLSCLPSAFAPSGQPRSQDQTQGKWDRVQRQLEILVQLVESQQTPVWLTPVLNPEDPSCILLALHSLLFGPLSWNFPPWQADLAVIEAEQIGNRYAHTSATTEQIRQWHQILRFLLLHRNALCNCWLETGTLRRVSEVLKAANGIASDPRTLLSVRLLCEYLNAAAEHDISQNLDRAFEQIWKEASGDALVATRYLPAQQRQEQRTIELRGVQQVQRRFLTEGLDSEFKTLLGILEAEVMRHSTAFRWISFDTEEFRKRWKEVARGIKNLHAGIRLAELEEYAVRVSHEDTADSVVLRVRPSRAFALLNRLPETTPAELQAIATSGFSAVSIFDTLLRNKLTNDGEGQPVWVPRVYRILDSMEDLDPEHVQRIRVSFSSSRLVPEFMAWLPIPSAPETHPGAQLKRKQILARYLAIEIYNYAVVRRVFGARFECDEATSSNAAFAFTTDELRRMIDEAELAYGQRKAYRAYLESFNFESFTIQPGEQLGGETMMFSPDIMAEPQRTFLGIDIGGTDIKFCLICDGRTIADPSVVQRPLGRFSTFPSPSVIEAKDFCDRIIGNIHASLKRPSETWATVSAIGLSWPGAVRNYRIVCPSKTLEHITSNGTKFGHNSPPADIHALNFTEVFLVALRAFALKHGFGLQDSLVCTIENDGNAEAIGNHCLRAIKQAREGRRTDPHPSGTVVVKLGTSLAGGRIDSFGAVADDVSEFGRAVLNLNVPKAEWPAGNARSLVSSLAVRNLSRTFEFAGKPLFGTRDGKNDEASIPWRIESVELGQLLSLWKAVDPGEQFLKGLVGSDNRPATADVEKLQASLAERLRRGMMQDKLTGYVRLRGKARFGKGQETDTEGIQWRLGLQRLHWLCNGQEADYAELLAEEIPSSFPYDDLARAVLGSVALYSHLSLQITHLIALLYNVYRRGTFAHVILAGGVLAGDTGTLVRTQADAFFAKYYDKIKAHFPDDGITLADTGEDPEAVGPLGAAMVANRQHKLNALRVMRRRIEKLMREKQPGGIVTITEAGQFCRDVRVAPESIRDFLQNLTAQGALVPMPDGSYRKV